ncbi:unnamed protein product [Brachionus calyciflorus]|uniref:Uncharacterized protein n=1 Tax=Brachionus calyciflorus TaxID=104777 RepID=A0A813VSP8_9BILA|nr:unnamed protein product [Brachionus calyciflorus]
MDKVEQNISEQFLFLKSSKEDINFIRSTISENDSDLDSIKKKVKLDGTLAFLAGALAFLEFLGKLGVIWAFLVILGKLCGTLAFLSSINI